MKRSLFIILLLLFIPIFLLAAGTEVNYPNVPHVPTPGTGTTFPQYVKYLFNLAIRIMGIVALGVLVWAGFLYLTSGGDVNQKEQAKEKIGGAFLGLLVFLFSYLILYTINPKLLELSLQEAEPTGGIYLIESNGKRHFINDTTDTMSYSNINQIEFVSPPSSLLAVYLYNKTGFRGNEKRVKNSAGSLASPLSEVKSVYFLWNRPGVYLCPTTTTPTETICPIRPLYTHLNISDLSATSPYFDNITQSVQFASSFQAVLFSDPGYEGRCAYSSENIPDLSASTTHGYNYPALGTSTLSSLIASEAEGDVEITFYDRFNCKGGSWTTTTIGRWIDLSATTSIRFSDSRPVFENIVSFSFGGDGSGAVLLNTDESATGTCEFFEKPKGNTNCIPNLVGEPVYESTPEPEDPGNQTKKVRALMILRHKR